MKNIINFFLRYVSWFIFIFYVIMSCVILFTYNTYQSSIYFSSANLISSYIYGTTSDISSYFNLRKTNESLLANNARLENEVLNLKYELAELRSLYSDSLIFDQSNNQRFDYIAATVVNNNVRHPKNYFSINRGSQDGIKPGMGVVDHNGIVGIVNVTGPHTSRAISLLNENQRFSVKLKNTEYIGSLSWKGGDPNIAYMEEVPRHARFHIGDTVVTSGYSLSFPQDIPVGTVLNRIRGVDDNFYILKIKLNSDFKALESVRVIKDNLKESLDSLSNFDLKN